MKKLLSPFRVGLLVLVAGTILFVFLSFSKKGGLSAREAMTVHATFRDASGLSSKSRVQIAGIAVGEVAEISLSGTRARVTMRISRNVVLHEDATLTKRSESLLGDYQLDLYPGSEAFPVIPDGGEITRVVDAQGMEQVFGSLMTIAKDVEAVTYSLRTVLGGDAGTQSLQAIVGNLVSLSAAMDSTVRDSSTQLKSILGNVDVIAGDVRGVTQSESAAIRRIVENLDATTADVKSVMATIKQAIGGNEGDLKEGVASLKSSLEKLDRSLSNIEEVTRQVKEGKGAVGALLNDERLGQKVSETVDDVADFAQGLTSLQAEVAVKAEYLIGQGQAKNSLGIKLIPRPDKYYLIELIDDPRGIVETTFVQTNPPNAGDPVVQKQTVTRDALKVSLQFAKRFSFLTLRFGIIESTGGIGVDFSFPIKFFWYSRWLEDAIVIKVDAFNFSVDSLVYPRLRATLRFSPVEHVYISAGVDDILNRPNREVLTNRLVTGRDFFFGAGVFFTDQDLKGILPFAGSIK